MQTANHDFMRNTNTLCILKCLMDSGSITKREIQDKTELSWGTISNITGELLSRKLISEHKSTESALGRLPSKLDINSSENLIIGLDINIEGLVAVIIDLKCRVLKKVKTGILENNREGIISQVKQIIHTLTHGGRL